MCLDLSKESASSLRDDFPRTQLELLQQVSIYIDNQLKLPSHLSQTILMRSFIIRQTKVHQESVNAIIVDDEPQSRLDRLLVALCVSIDKRSDTVVLHETALLPNLPSLPAAICLLFTPFVELR